MGNARKSRVEVQAILTAVSSKPTGPGRIHPLTGFDHAMDHHTVHVIFYYAESPFSSFDLDPIRISLSELLSVYPPVTGRMTRNEVGNWEVKCNDAGVRILRAKVGVGLDEWLRTADGDDERDLTVWEEMPEDPSTWSPFRIQINEFEGGGVAIGLCCSHRQADPTTLTVLFKSWTEAQRHQPISHPPFFAPLPQTLRDPNPVNSQPPFHYSQTKPKTTPPNKMATATFKFPGAAFKRCLDESVAGIFPNASPFDVFTALFLTRVIHTKCNCDCDNDRSYSVAVCVDFRRILQEPLPYGFFGNALHFSSLEINPNELGHVARTISHHVASLDAERIRLDLNRFESREGGKYRPPVQMYGTDLTIVSMEHMIVDGQPLMYETAFENGVRPAHVSYQIGSAGGEGVIAVMPSPENGYGRMVAVTLPEDGMEKLLADQEILRLEPKINLSGGTQ